MFKVQGSKASPFLVQRLTFKVSSFMFLACCRVVARRDCTMVWD